MFISYKKYVNNVSGIEVGPSTLKGRGVGADNFAQENIKKPTFSHGKCWPTLAYG